jgi:hypothetical protein
VRKIKSKLTKTPYLVLFTVLIAISVTSAYALTITLGGDLIEILGTLNMNNNKITNLATPTLDFDAATKKYVDDNAVGGALFLKTVERTGSSVMVSGDNDGSATVDCMVGEVATGGGFHEITEEDAIVFESIARLTEGVATGWEIGFFSSNDNTVTLEATVICATLQNTSPLP